ncbi:MAG: hypothetical protein V1834_00385 [Candidatus Micrarchaeota archaeon]
MRRGQAFETMMLVISVIVAVAILGILLGFIGGIGTFGANAKTVMPDLMKKVSQRGSGLEIKDKVEFSAGDRIYQKDAVGEAAISPLKVKFFCQDPDLCEGDGPLEITDQKIVVNSKINAVIAVCSKDGVDYKVVVGSQIEATSLGAEAECDLTGP